MTYIVGGSNNEDFYAHCAQVAIALHLPLLCSYHCSADVIKQHDFGVASCLLYVLEACVSRRTMLSRQKQERKLFSEKYP